MGSPEHGSKRQDSTNQKDSHIETANDSQQ